MFPECLFRLSRAVVQVTNFHLATTKLFCVALKIFDPLFAVVFSFRPSHACLPAQPTVQRPRLLKMRANPTRSRPGFLSSTCGRDRGNHGNHQPMLIKTT